MKINAQDIPNIAQPRKTLNKQPDSATGQFDALLEKAMMPQNGQVSSTKTLLPLQSLSSLSFAVPVGGGHSQTVKQIDEFISLMESYQKKLADPAISLKEIHPLVQQMEKKSAELLPVLESLPDGDKLKDILNRTLIASSVEVIKFNRGDYV